MAALSSHRATVAVMRVLRHCSAPANEANEGSNWRRYRIMLIQVLPAGTARMSGMATMMLPRDRLLRARRENALTCVLKDHSHSWAFLTLTFRSVCMPVRL